MISRKAQAPEPSARANNLASDASVGINIKLHRSHPHLPHTRIAKAELRHRIDQGFLKRKPRASGQTMNAIAQKIIIENFGDCIGSWRRGIGDRHLYRESHTLWLGFMRMDAQADGHIEAIQKYCVLSHQPPPAPCPRTLHLLRV